MRRATWFKFLGFVVIVAMAGCGGRSRTAPPPGALVKKDGPAIRRDLGPGPDMKPRDVKVWHKDRQQPPPPPPDWWVPPHLDKGPPPPPDKGGLCTAAGKLCTPGKTSCCSGTACVMLKSGLHLCLRKCLPDNYSTPLLNEDTCPTASTTGKQFCADISPPAQQHYCLHTCAPALGKNDCAPGLACQPRSAGLAWQVFKAVCMYAPCKGVADCPVYLSKTCTTAGSVGQCSNAGLPAGAKCTAPPPGAAAGAPLRCAVPGVCDTKSGLCAPHKLGNPKAKVGDACNDDRHCGGQMRCEMQHTSASGLVHARNGYCLIEGCTFAKTLPSRACPTGSTCKSLTQGGTCFLTCSLNNAQDCRGNAKDKLGDYECRAWNNLSVGGNPIVSKSVCEPGDRMKCDMLQTSKLDCSSVGLQSNPTKMSCRHPTTGKTLANKYDPSGYCLDDSASGK